MSKKEAEKRKRLNATTKVLAVLATLFIVANVVVGVILIFMSHKSIKEMNESKMLGIANTAAACLNGDELKDLTAKDVGSKKYRAAFDCLSVFRDNNDMKFIYCVQKVDEGRFILTIDPAKEEAGKFGDAITTTDALVSASKGVPAVDDKPYKDSWGEFYSAYSPVFDSEGEVVAIVAVDFTAKQYEKNIRDNTNIVILISVLALTGGALIVLIATHRMRKKFMTLYGDLSSLSDNIDDLNREIVDARFQKFTEDKNPEQYYMGKDEISKLNAKIRYMQRELSAYTEYAYKMAYADSLTGVKNKTAYFEKVKELKEKMKKRKAAFSMAVFDINGLKKMNDNYGHEYGDRMIADLVKIMADVFGSDNVYRIGGDEFIAVLEDATAEQMQEYFRMIDEKVDAFNKFDSTYPVSISFSKGAATLDKEKDTDYRMVFKRADERMYADKQAFYKDKNVVYAAHMQK